MAKGYDYQLVGLQNVLRNLNKEVKKIKDKTGKGVYKAALLVERGSKQRTPVDTGNLKAGTYVRKIYTSGYGSGAEIGYTSIYAVHVHEKCENYHHVGECKFLEKTLKAEKNKILRIIQGEIAV